MSRTRERSPPRGTPRSSTGELTTDLCWKRSARRTTTTTSTTISGPSRPRRYPTSESILVGRLDREVFPMSDLSSATKALAIGVVTAGFLAGLVHITGLWPAVRSPQNASATAFPNFGPDVITSWFPDREEGDDF